MDHPHTLSEDDHARRTARLLRHGAMAIDLVSVGLLNAIHLTGPVPRDVLAAVDDLAWSATTLQALADVIEGCVNASSN